MILWTVDVVSSCVVCVVFVQAEERRSHVEVCAEGGVLVQQLARRISKDGGAALIADYGHDGTKGDTFRVRAQATPTQSTGPTLKLFLAMPTFE